MTLPVGVDLELTASTTQSITPPASEPGLAEYAAPGSGLLVALAVVAGILREWRKGRQQRVEDAEKDAREARRAQHEAEAERDRHADQLGTKIKRLEEEVISVREELRRSLFEQESRHRDELRAQESRHRVEREEWQRRDERAVMENYRLRRLVAFLGGDPDTGLPIDIELADDELGADLETATGEPPRARRRDDVEHDEGWNQ